MSDVVIINQELCQGCGICADMCPQHILYVDDASGKVKVKDHSRCDRRRGCERACPAGAIKVK